MEKKIKMANSFSSSSNFQYFLWDFYDLVFKKNRTMFQIRLLKNALNWVIALDRGQQDNISGWRLICHLVTYLVPYWSAIDFEKLSFKNQVEGIFWTWILKTAKAVKIKFELDQKSSSSISIFQTRFFKYQVQINRGYI